MRNLCSSFIKLNRIAEASAVLSLAQDLAVAAENEDGVTVGILHQMRDDINRGRFAEAQALDSQFRRRTPPHTAVYLPGDAEYWRCVSQFFQGQLSDEEWQAGIDLAVRHRNVIKRAAFLGLRAEWDLTQDRPERALEAIDQALQMTNKMGAPFPGYHDLRAWALARLHHTADAQAELQKGEQRLFAAETYCVLGDHEQARACALNAYRWAWGEGPPYGPPYTNSYYLERSRGLLRQLGEPGTATATVRPIENLGHSLGNENTRDH